MYYQAHTDFTILIATFIANNNYSLLLTSTIIAFLSGKRMALVSSIVMILSFAISQFVRRASLLTIPISLKIKKSLLIYLFILISLIMSLVIYSFDITPALDKFLTFTRLFSNYYGSVDFGQKLLIIDPARYLEVVSSFSYLQTPFDFICGLGLGFVYEIIPLPSMLAPLASIENLKGVSNVHFSPVGILVNSGILGVISYLGMFVFSIRSLLSQPKSKLSTTLTLCLIGVYVETFFAYNLFADFFNPLIFALCTSKIFTTSNPSF